MRVGHREQGFKLVTANENRVRHRETFRVCRRARHVRAGHCEQVFELVAAKMFSKLATENKSNWSPRQNVRAGHRKKYVRVGRREEIELVTATSDRRGHREKK